MGKGDQKSTRGKRARGSYGKTRPKKSNSRSDVMAQVATSARAVKKKAEKEIKAVKAAAAKHV
jgi:30S ribosomal protein S31